VKEIAVDVPDPDVAPVVRSNASPAIVTGLD
jgi:hypothetical protein